MVKKIIILSLIMVTFNELVLTQTLNWDGELRVRAELDNRDFNNSTPPNYFTLFRARLGAEYVPIENLKFYFQIQDARLFGEERNSRNEFNTIANTKNLDIHQAYIQIQKFLVDEITLKIGRQRLSFGSERFVGAVLWSNIGRIFDGGLIQYQVPKHRISLFLMNTGETNRVPITFTPDEFKFTRDEGQLFSGVNYEIGYFENLSFEVFTYHQLNKNISVSGYNDLSRFTSGIYSKGKFLDGLFYETDFAYQYGQKKGIDVSAYLIAVTLGYNLNIKPLTSFLFSYERLSGKKEDDNKYKSFDPPYATMHKFYGYMDYFMLIPVNTYERGLQDLHARLNLKLSDNLTSHVTIHNFALSEVLEGEKQLGNELDIVLNWKYNKYLQFEVGGGIFIPGKIMQSKFMGYDVSQWGYITTLMQF